MLKSKKKGHLLPPINLVAANAHDFTNGNPLALSRKLSDTRTIIYPDGIACNRFDLDEDTKHGLVRYDRGFLLQFMPVCKQRPEMLPPLEDFGLMPNGYLPVTRGNSGRHRQSAAVTPHQGFGALGTFSGTSGSSNHFGVVESHVTTPATKLTSEEKFAQSHEKILARSSKLESSSPVASNTVMVHNLPTVDEDSVSPEMVGHGVKALLNDLTVHNIDNISSRIIQWANASEDGRTLEQIIHLVVDKAIDNTTQPEVYANLCKTMMRDVSSRIRDTSMFNGQGEVMRGRQLFRKYLHHRCLSDVNRRWVTKEAVDAEVSTAPQSIEDERVAAVIRKSRSDEDGKDDPDQEADIPIHTNEYNAAREAKRQRFGIIKFIGELFKQRGLKKGTVHQCLETFIGLVNPDEEDIESFCMLLTAVGKKLAVPRKARAKFNRYILRMNEWIKNPNVAHQMRDMLREVIRLREREWISGTIVTAHVGSDGIHQVMGAMKTASSKGQVVVAQANNLHTPVEAGELYIGSRTRPQSIFVEKKDAANTQRRHLQNAEHNEDGSDAASGMSTMTTPPESDLMGQSSNIQHKRQSNNEKTVVEFLERLVGMRMCSTALVSADEKQDAIESIVNDIASQAPDALRKLSLMVRGAGLD